MTKRPANGSLEDLARSVVSRAFLYEGRDELLAVLRTLTQREEEIIGLRFGLHGAEPMTLEEVGKRFGVTRERIRQIEIKALSKLRYPSRAAALRD